MHSARFSLQEEINFINVTRRVLVIDDEDHLREIVKISLELNNSWEVITVGSGSEGIAIAKATHPDIILLDLIMPQEDGRVIFQQLRNSGATQHIPVLFFTAKAQESELQLLLNLGVNGILKKPFDPITLSNEVAQYLDWRSLNNFRSLALAS